MESLEELTSRRDALKAELTAVEKDIGRHPSTIKNAFAHNPEWDMDAFELLVQRITFIRRITGKYDLDGEWTGFVYQIDDKNYRVRCGGSGVFNDDWMECGPVNQEQKIPLEFAKQLWHEEDPVTSLKVNQQMEDWMVVGYLLTLSLVAEDYFD